MSTGADGNSVADGLGVEPNPAPKAEQKINTITVYLRNEEEEDSKDMESLLETHEKEINKCRTQFKI
jgi:hypothetical protein